MGTIWGNSADDHAVARLFTKAHPELKMAHLHGVTLAGLSWADWINIVSKYYAHYGPELWATMDAVFQALETDERWQAFITNWTVRHPTLTDLVCEIVTKLRPDLPLPTIPPDPINPYPIHCDDDKDLTPLDDKDLTPLEPKEHAQVVSDQQTKSE